MKKQVNAEHECGGKKGYDTVSAAKWSCRMLREVGERMHPYVCSVCHLWHIGHGERRFKAQHSTRAGIEEDE